jgi:hypothetical protein
VCCVSCMHGYSGWLLWWMFMCHCSSINMHLIYIDYGQFYVFDLSHAKCVVRLLCNNSYVRFGNNFFKQTKGIPMGINPAVFMANYYLF